MNSRLLLTFPALLLLSHPVRAALRPAYTADADTVHLYHFEEPALSTTAANAGSAGSGLIAVTITGAVVNPAPTVDTFFGTAGYSGYGSAASLGAASAGNGLAFDSDGSGTFQPDNLSTVDFLPVDNLRGGDGSFTLEAMVNFDSLTGKQREIICMDSSQAARAFQYRINTAGEMEFNFISTATAAFKVPVPTTGSHAFTPDTWFHAAMSFDGLTNSVKFYWTRVDPGFTIANLIGTGTEAVTGSVTGPLVIGNENRNLSGEGLRGLIDEVRISSVVRPATDFLFYSTANDGDNLPDGWEDLYFHNLDQTDNGDPDGDTFTNLEEYHAETDPTLTDSSPDTDGDGLPDGWEIRSFRASAGETREDILAKYSGTDDPDGDRFSNAQEFAALTNPLDRLSNAGDTDSDGLSDPWELCWWGDLSIQTGSGDADSDGISNAAEQSAASNPLNPLSTPADKDGDGIPDADAAIAPYSVDAATLHLWTFDCGTTGPVPDQVYAGSNLTMAALNAGATLGNPSLSGFGGALDTSSARDSVLGVSGDTGATPFSFAGEDGAFTFEALILPTWDIASGSTPAAQEIIAGDADFNRLWQFRINAVPGAPTLELNVLSTGGNQIIVPLPLEGVQAIVPGQWYHVAVAFTGEEGAFENLRFYWTRIGSGASEAQLLDVPQTLNADIARLATDFTIGNEGRGLSGESFLGYIDEVRISSVARSATDFLFTGNGGGPDNGYAAWAVLNAGSQAPDLDSDGDGVANGIEYFLNAPAGRTTLPAPVGNTVSWPNGGNLPATGYGLQFTVQTSPDLQSWTSVDSADPLLTNTGSSVSYTFSPDPTDPVRFARLKVTPR